jgi:lysophospholipase L1-like esterase
MITRSLPSDRRTPLVYVALGDSTVYGLGASSPTNHGTCLATAGDVLADQVPDAILSRPQLVTLSVGPNVEVILERLDRETDAAVILNALPDLASAPRFRQPERSMVAALTRHYNHALRHVADGFGVELGYHPSEVGYAAWAGVLWEAVRARIPAQTRLAATPA